LWNTTDDSRGCRPIFTDVNSLGPACNERFNPRQGCTADARRHSRKSTEQLAGQRIKGRFRFTLVLNCLECTYESIAIITTFIFVVIIIVF